MKGNLSKRKGLLSEITDKHLSQIVNSLKEKVLSVLVLKEDVANKETKITEDSTDTGYPSSKAVKDYAQPKESGKGLSSNDFTDGFKIKLENIDENANNYILPDDVVKNTDYATRDAYGIVKIGAGLQILSTTGALAVSPAGSGAITARSTNVMQPIIPGNLNFAVKSALSDANRINDMTDEEKTNARGVIGAAAEADCEKTSNKVTTITDASTDSQYPSAKAVYTELTKLSADVLFKYNNLNGRKENIHELEIYNSASMNIPYLLSYRDCRFTNPLTSLTLSGVRDDIDSYLSFTSGETPTSLTYPASTIKWVGVDCDADGDFIPSANTNYEISVRTVNKDSSGKAIIVARVGVY